ncbi:hypothetical protein [Enterococcus innesii]|uniref:hypothetical protein n=1 Tax=Enterococcus innesii TaxID=2839759 RepID=UPI003D79F915
MEKEKIVDLHTYKNDKEITLEEMIEIRKERKKNKKEYFSFTQIKKFLGDLDTTEVVQWFLEQNIVEKRENGKVGLIFTNLEVEEKCGFLNTGVNADGKEWEQPLFNKETAQKYIDSRMEEEIEIFLKRSAKQYDRMLNAKIGEDYKGGMILPQNYLDAIHEILA